jgi:hypothetical protein
MSLRRRFLLLVPPCALTASLALAAACGNSDDSGSPGPVDSGPADGVAPIIVYDAAMPDLDASCNAVSTGGPQITTTIPDEDATAPTAAGGTVVDGTYTLTALEWYMGDPLEQLPPTTSTTLVVSGGGAVWQTAGTDVDTGVFTVNYAATYDGDKITLDETCPGADTEIDETFTATPTTITLLDTYESEPYVRVYTLTQP